MMNQNQILASKKCNKCLETKDISQFHKKKLGYASFCKLCCKKYREENKEKIKVRKQNYNKVNKDKAKNWGDKETKKLYRINNKKKLNEKRKKI
jgi:hypothetical protein